MGCGFVAVVPEADAADAAALLAGHHPGAAAHRHGHRPGRHGERPGRRAPRRLTALDACRLRPGGADADAGREPWPRPSPAPTRTRPSPCGTPGARRGTRRCATGSCSRTRRWSSGSPTARSASCPPGATWTTSSRPAWRRSCARWTASTPAKGATLEQFLWTRVHGAVLDELRKHDWAPRSVRRGLRAAGDAADHFTAIHGRHPTREELADATGMTVAELRALHDDAARAEVGSLNVPVRADDHQVVERIDTLEDRAPGEDPLDVAAGEQAQDTFRAGVHAAARARAGPRRPALRRGADPAGGRPGHRDLREPRLAAPHAAAHPAPRRARRRARALRHRLGGVSRARRRGRARGAPATRTPAARARRAPAGRAGRRPRPPRRWPRGRAAGPPPRPWAAPPTGAAPAASAASRRAATPVSPSSHRSPTRQDGSGRPRSRATSRSAPKASTIAFERRSTAKRSRSRPGTPRTAASTASVVSCARRSTRKPSRRRRSTGPSRPCSAAALTARQAG